MPAPMIAGAESFRESREMIPPYTITSTVLVRIIPTTARSNTLVCTTVLFGLNALAHEHEDPFGDSGDDVDLGVMLAGFRKAVQCYEERREMAEQGNAGLSSEDIIRLAVVDFSFFF